MFNIRLQLKRNSIFFVFITLGLIGSYEKQANAIPVLADTLFLQSQGIKPISSVEKMNLSFAEITETQAEALSFNAHQFGKCGGFERLRPNTNIAETLSLLARFKERAHTYTFIGRPSPTLEKKDWIQKAIQEIRMENLQSTVQWLSGFSSRYHKGKTRNDHVEQLAARIRTLLSSLSYPYTIELVSHIETPQKSLRVHLEGSQNPTEVVVLGGHLDSIANWGRGPAPGADDNASGSANILETLRIIAQQAQPQRSIDFFWYAGEEAGLIGSSEIAENYKSQGIDVIGVMQLDMTLFPGDGELVMGDMKDYTDPWLRSYMRTISDMYVGTRWNEDECGYGCSDHASWHRQGYATVMPFESTMSTMNGDIHTQQDVVSPRMSFKHSEAFTKLALAFVLDLAHSQIRPVF